MRSMEIPLVSYGDDGPVFERLCPSCGRFIKMPDKMKWQEDFSGRCTFEKIECKKCGSVEPSHVGWSGDYF